MYGINDYLSSCEYRKKFLLEQSAWLTEEKNNFQSDAMRLDGVLERIRQEMIGYLIPEVHDDHIAALEKRLSYPGLSPIKQKYDALFETTERRRVELETMDEIQHFDFQIDQAQRRVDDVQPTRDSMHAELTPWENSKWFAGLNKRGYFEHDYSAGLWRRFFDWRAVSFLMGVINNHMLFN